MTLALPHPGTRRPLTDRLTTTSGRLTSGERRVLGFVLLTLACALGLVFFGNVGAIRLPLRMTVYAGSLILLVFYHQSRDRHPASRWVMLVPVFLVTGMALPGRSTILAGVGQALLWVSVLAPLWWVSAARVRLEGFRKILFVLWAFGTISAAVGVLQVYYPGRFEGQISANYLNDPQFHQGRDHIHLADGSRVIRPMGLTDAPGGAVGGGLTAITLGAGLLLTDRRRWVRWVVPAGMATGLFIIFLGQKRTPIVMAILCVGVLLFLLGRRADWKRLGKLLWVVGAVATVGTVWAFRVGGDQTINRFATLTQEAPGTVFYESRGKFLEQFFTHDLFAYPLGAGSGRWGMMWYYFGQGRNNLWSEMTWTSLLYDGGVPLVVVYLGALTLMMAVSWRIAVSRIDKELAIWGAVMVGFNFASISSSLIFPIFSMEAGMQVWLLNACLWGAYVHRRRLRTGPARVPGTAPKPTPTGYPPFRTPAPTAGGAGT